MKIEDVNKQVEIFLSWLESYVAEADPGSDSWVIKINNADLTKEDKNMISLLNNTTTEFSSKLYEKGYKDFEVGIDSIEYTNRTEIRYIKKYEENSCAPRIIK